MVIAWPSCIGYLLCCCMMNASAVCDYVSVCVCVMVSEQSEIKHSNKTNCQTIQKRRRIHSRTHTHTYVHTQKSISVGVDVVAARIWLSRFRRRFNDNSDFEIFFYDMNFDVKSSSSIWTFFAGKWLIEFSKLNTIFTLCYFRNYQIFQRLSLNFQKVTQKISG